MHCVLNHAIDIVDDTHATGEVYNVTYLLRDYRRRPAARHLVGPLPRPVRMP
jgi:hypothetical protein